MRWMSFLAFASVAFACGGAQDSPLLDGGTSADDGSTESDGSKDGGANCDISRCVVVPDGFSPVGLSNGNAACPDGWASTDVVTSPTATDGACTCGCNITQQPDCTQGAIARFIDNANTASCNYQGTTLQANGGACTAIGANLYLNLAHYSVDAPAGAGGVCQFDAKVNPSAITSTSARMCAPPASCLGALCSGGNVCVSKDGDVACPAGFPTKTLVGASATADCTPCGAKCAVQTKCGGTLSFFTDQGCTMGKVDFTADGTCAKNPASSPGPYAYYTFTGTTAGADCGGGTPTSTATPKLASPKTVCCQH